MNPQELYQEIIMDHAARPRNFGPLEGATVKVEAENPLCGDEITLYLQVSEEGGGIAKTAFTGQACAICMASASILTTKVKTLPFCKARALSQQFQGLLTSPEEPDPGALGASNKSLGNLTALTGVRKFPMRIKCATLCWHALDRAIDQAESGGGEAKLTLDEPDAHS